METLLDCKQQARIVAKDLLGDFGRHRLDLFFNNVLRVGPRTCGMGIVGTKHYLVGIEDTPHDFYAARVIDEADPNLAVEVFAGQHLHCFIVAPVSHSP
jgi:hypothetical protein